MDLNVEDVANLLHVSKKTVQRWVADSRIPYYKLNQQYRFSRSEIENWVLSAKSDGDFPPCDEAEIECCLGSQQFSLYRAIHKGGVYAGIKGETKEDVICAAMQRIAVDLHLDAEVIIELLLDRERLMPTALSQGIAVPHTRDFLLQESFDVVSVVFLEQPIDYGALDGKLVHTLFFLFACDDKRHLHLLAKLAHLSSRLENLSFFKRRPSKELLLDRIKTWEMNLKTKEDQLCRT